MTRSKTTPTSDSIHDGMHGQVTVTGDHKEVNMAEDTDFVIESDQEFEASVASDGENGKQNGYDGNLGSSEPQNHWKEALHIELKTWEDGTPSALKVIVNPDVDGAATFGHQTIDAKSVANLILCDLRSGAYRDLSNSKVLLKVPLDLAFARGNVPSVGYVHWTHSGDFGNFGQLKLFNDGWTEIGVYSEKLVPTWHVSAAKVAQAMNLYNNERDSRTKKMIRVFYRCEALRALLSGVNARIRIGSQSEEYIMSRFNECWSEDDVTKANAAYSQILYRERHTYNRLQNMADQRRVANSGGTLKTTPQVQEMKTNGGTGNGKISVTSRDGEVLTIGEIPYPTHVWVYDKNNYKSAVDDTLGANTIADEIWANELIATESTFEIIS